MALGTKLKELRSKLGWKQVTLSQKSGVPQATVSRIESGKVTQPKMGQLRKLADALGITIDYLAGDSIHERRVSKGEEMTQKELEQKLNILFSRSSTGQIIHILAEAKCGFMLTKYFTGIDMNNCGVLVTDKPYQEFEPIRESDTPIKAKD